jgi:hypothetical protein
MHRFLLLYSLCRHYLSRRSCDDHFVLRSRHAITLASTTVNSTFRVARFVFIVSASEDSEDAGYND